MIPDLNQRRIFGSNSGTAVFALPLLVGVALALSGCSWLTSTLRLDNVTDSVDYRSGSGSIAHLEIPPGLTKPRFDDTYVLSRSIQASDAAVPKDQIPVPLMADASKMANTMGGEKSDATASAPQTLPVVLTQLKDGNPTLAVGGRFDQVWVKTGSVLAKSGLEIVDQQRDKGIYSVTASQEAAEEDGLLKKLWSRINIFADDAKKTTKDADTYRVVIGDAGDQCLLVVSDAAGKPLEPVLAKQLLERLKAGLEG